MDRLRPQQEHREGLGRVGAARRWGLSEGHLALSIRCDAPVAGIGFTPNGNLAIANQDGRLQVWEFVPNEFVTRSGTGSLHEMNSLSDHQSGEKPDISLLLAKFPSNAYPTGASGTCTGQIVPRPFAQVELTGPLIAVTFTNVRAFRGAFVALSVSDDGVDTETGMPIPMLPNDPSLHMTRVSFDRSGHRVAALFRPRRSDHSRRLGARNPTGLQQDIGADGTA